MNDWWNYCDTYATIGTSGDSVSLSKSEQEVVSFLTVVTFVVLVLVIGITR